MKAATIDINRVREDTPGCLIKTHFNNAGSSLPPRTVTEAAMQYTLLEAQHGGYEWADEQAHETQKFYTSAARLLSTHANNIAFTSSATHSFALALSSIPFVPNDVILIANEDYISNQIAFLSLEKRFNIKLVRAKSLPEGGVDMNDVKQLINRYHPTLVSITHVPSNTGLVQPVEEIGRLCQEKEILYLVDACQSVGQFDVSIKNIPCDFLCTTLRKFLRGPRGAGMLYVSDRVLKTNLAPLCIDLRGAEWTDKDHYRIQPTALRFENWERSHALMLAGRVAIDYALQLGLDNIKKRNNYLCALVQEKLDAIKLKIADHGKLQSSIITVQIPKKEAQKTMRFLRNKNINTSTSSRQQAQIDFEKKKINWVLRISPHYFNTEEEIDRLIQALNEWTSQ